MLFRQKFLDGIREGRITLAFRRWRRPTVRSGGRLLTPVGQLGIASVSRIEIRNISEEDARRAGYQSLEGLLQELHERTEGDIYRIELGALRPDPRAALRSAVVESGEEQRALLQKVARSPWALSVLQLISDHPGRRAGDLCGFVGQGKDAFKSNVRRLKALGLTESLGTGYRLSPRGEAFLRTVQNGRQ